MEVLFNIKGVIEHNIITSLIFFIVANNNSKGYTKNILKGLVMMRSISFKRIYQKC